MTRQAKIIQQVSLQHSRTEAPGSQAISPSLKRQAPSLTCMAIDNQAQCTELKFTFCPFQVFSKAKIMNGLKIQL